MINPSLDWGDSEEASGPDFRILGVPDQGTYAERIVVAAHQVRERTEAAKRPARGAAPAVRRPLRGNIRRRAGFAVKAGRIRSSGCDRASG